MDGERKSGGMGIQGPGSRFGKNPVTCLGHFRIEGHESRSRRFLQMLPRVRSRTISQYLFNSSTLVCSLALPDTGAW